MTRHKELGAFLRARRERLQPEEAGLPPRSRRRTSGLRREDVADLAGVSLSWYTWLEQGREVQASAAVLANIARALRLSSDDIGYLFDLAGEQRPAERAALRTTITPSLQRILDALDPVPAYVLNERWDRIGWNPTLLQVMGDFRHGDPMDRNIIWRVFMNPRTREFTVNWEHIAKLTLAEFRAATSRYVGEPWMSDFLAMMEAGSADFRRLWRLNEILSRREKPTEILNDQVGALRLEHFSFYLAEDPELMMSVFSPLDQDTGRKLARLAQLRNE